MLPILWSERFVLSDGAWNVCGFHRCAGKAVLSYYCCLKNLFAGEMKAGDRDLVRVKTTSFLSLTLAAKSKGIEN